MRQCLGEHPQRSARRVQLLDMQGDAKNPYFEGSILHTNTTNATKGRSEAHSTLYACSVEIMVFWHREG